MYELAVAMISGCTMDAGASLVATSPLVPWTITGSSESATGLQLERAHSGRGGCGDAAAAATADKPTPSRARAVTVIARLFIMGTTPTEKLSVRRDRSRHTSWTQSKKKKN